MPLFQRGSRFGSPPYLDRWLVTRKLGEGQFAEVYEVRDTLNKDNKDQKYAVKIEKRRESKTVKQELKALKRLCQSHAQVCQVYDTGTYDERFYIVMELLGENLAEARRAADGGVFPPAQVQAIGGSILGALEAMHEAGYIHRDVKPANFAVTLANPNPATGTWAVIDFGLARKYVGEGGEVLPQRLDAAFRGSTSYASVHAHRQQDQGRRDDLWGWLYILVELLEGTLPWRQDKEVEPAGRDSVLQWKEACIHHPHNLSRTACLPEPLVEISRYLHSLGYADAPDYAFIRHQLALLAACPPSTTEAAAAGPPHTGWGTGVDAVAPLQLPSTSPYWAGDQGRSPLQEATDPPTSTYPTQRDASDAAEVGPSPASPFTAGPSQPPLPHQRNKWPHDPDLGAGEQQHQQRPHRRHRAGSEQPGRPGSSAREGANGVVEAAGADSEEADRVQDVMDFVEMFRQGGVSAEAQEAVRQLCRLDPAEGLGVLATTMELLVDRTQPAGLPHVASFLSAISAFSADASRRALLRHCSAAATAAATTL